MTSQPMTLRETSQPMTLREMLITLVNRIIYTANLSYLIVS